MPTTPCPKCGAQSAGKFCAECGTPLAGATCASCQTPLTPGAKFCHSCGAPAGAGRRAKGPWVAAGVLTVFLLGWLVWRVNRGVEPAPPPAGRDGGANAPFAAGGGSPPDLSQMTPRDAFLRLHDRIMSALEQGDTATVDQFTPMAIQSYAGLSAAERDIDLRYHAATIYLGSGDRRTATAITDSIAREVPGHLFATMLRAGIAEAAGDERGAARAYRQFLADYDRQVAAGRQEYNDHRPLLDAFKTRAETVGR